MRQNLGNLGMYLLHSWIFLLLSLQSCHGHVEFFSIILFPWIIFVWKTITSDFWNNLLRKSLSFWKTPCVPAVFFHWVTFPTYIENNNELIKSLKDWYGLHFYAVLTNQSIVFCTVVYSFDWNQFYRFDNFFLIKWLKLNSVIYSLFIFYSKRIHPKSLWDSMQLRHNCIQSGSLRQWE